MDETTLIEQMQSHLNTEFDVAVRTSALSNERPVPAIILDDWTIDPITYHTTPLSQHRYTDIDGDGQKEVERVFRFHYEARLEFVVRHADEVGASQLKTQLTNVFRELKLNPCQLHDDVKWVRLVRSGDPTFSFREPKENELHTGCLLESFHEIRHTAADTDWDPITVIQDSFSIEGNEFHTGSLS